MAETTQEKLEALVGRIKKVRCWLLALAILKVAGLSTVFVSGYIGVYAWLDHHVNFGMFGRITAFVLLLAGSAFLLYKLARYLVSHISCSGAANFIESRHSFNQQLVTAVEFYEEQHDYPYSRTLAEQLVLQVCKQTEGFKFESTIDKWHGYVLAAVVLFGLGSVLFYVRANYLYISAYFARLTRPLAAVEPLASTSLRPITLDIVAEPNTPVTFAAQIEGPVPESGKLVLVPADSNSPDSAAALQREEIQLLPNPNTVEKPELRSSKSFAKTGLFKYRFEAGSARTEWHQVDIHPAPQIESVTAEVLLPPRPPRNMRVEPHTEQIVDQTLTVMPDSSITLTVQATGPLREAAITGLDGQAVTKQLGGADQFTFSFTAGRKGTISFRLVDESGLSNENVPDLQVIVRSDEPPKITLTSPEGDYVTTDVASVPITFEFSDDFGLASGDVVLEIPRQQPRFTAESAETAETKIINSVVSASSPATARRSAETSADSAVKELLAIPITQGVKSHTYTHIVELEQYDLRVGDSILFYAQASDIDTGSALPSRSSSSDVYFIEIRPYRQNWHPQPGGGQGSGAGTTPEELLTILEYTRAILKKTWTIADKPALSDEDCGRLKAINDDVQYCATQLATMRDDSEYGFDDQAKAILNQVLQSYGQASEFLAGHNAIGALPAEKDAYSTLRKFILELEMLWNPPSSGQSSPQEKPDSVKLQESPEFSQYEKERIEGEMKKLQQKLRTLTREQKLLKTDFENFLEQQTQQETSRSSPDARRPTDEGRGKIDKAKTDAQGKKDSTSQPGKTGDKSPATARRSAETSSDAKSDSAGQSPAEGQKTSDSQSDKKGETASSSKSTGGSQNASQGASTEAKLRMFQAKQKAIQEKVSQLKKDLEQLPSLSEAQQAQAQQKAQEHLANALAKMDEFQAAVTATRYQPSITNKKAAQAVELMESARQKLDQATSAIGQGLSMSEEQRHAEKAQEIAEQLAEDANAVDESGTPIQKEEMLARLEAAKRLLDSMSVAQWSTVNKGANRSAPVHVFTKDPRVAPAEAARAISRQFWSIAIEAKKRKSQLIEDEPSDVKFYEMENKFFENAAKFSQESVKK